MRQARFLLASALLLLFRLLLDWPQLQAACGKDMRRPGHWHRVRVYHFNEAAAASQIYPIPVDAYGGIYGTGIMRALRFFII